MKIETKYNIGDVVSYKPNPPYSHVGTGIIIDIDIQTFFKGEKFYISYWIKSDNSEERIPEESIFEVISDK